MLKVQLMAKFSLLALPLTLEELRADHLLKMLYNPDFDRHWQSSGYYYLKSSPIYLYHYLRLKRLDLRESIYYLSFSRS